MSRSMSTPRKWWSSLLAPVVMLRRSFRAEVSDDQQFKIRFFRAALLRSDSAEAAGAGAEQFANLFRMRRAHCGCRQTVRELRLMQLMIAAKQSQHRLRLVVNGRDVNQRLDLLFGLGAAGKRSQIFDRAHARRRKLFRRVRSNQVLDRRQPRSRFLEIRCVTAVGAARNQVFAGVSLRHELVRLRAAHRAGRRFHNRKLNAAAT